jgi:Holliday junction resolvase-like predicted endonuclease
LNTKLQLATAAEAFAAARFARLGFNVSVQYGANQPEYDLMIDKAGEVLKVSVKGSANGGWGLSQSQLAKLGDANYHGAADAWLARHKPGTVLCLVQFKGTQPDEMPRIYLASPQEIANKLRSASGGRGDTILWEDYQRGPKAEGAGTVEQLPLEWLLNEGRINELLHTLTTK